MVVPSTDSSSRRQKDTGLIHLHLLGQRKHMAMADVRGGVGVGWESTGRQGTTLSSCQSLSCSLVPGVVTLTLLL